MIELEKNQLKYKVVVYSTQNVNIQSAADALSSIIELEQQNIVNKLNNTPCVIVHGESEEKCKSILSILDTFCIKASMSIDKGSPRNKEYNYNPISSSFVKDMQTDFKGNKSTVKCPTCGSDNIRKISFTRRAVSVTVLGLASSSINKQFECKSCGYKW